MTQARVVIRGAALEMGERLLQVTRLASLTELINVMFSRYGRHLEETWEVLPATGTDGCADGCAQREAKAEIVVPASIPNTDFKFRLSKIQAFHTIVQFFMKFHMRYMTSFPHFYRN